MLLVVQSEVTHSDLGELAVGCRREQAGAASPRLRRRLCGEPSRASGIPTDIRSRSYAQSVRAFSRSSLAVRGKR